MRSSANAEPGPARLFPAIFIFFLFMAACQKPSSKIKSTIKNSTANVVKKVKPPQVFSKKKRKKKLYITFDDGPNRGTGNVLHIVQDEQIPVTFFVVGEHVFASNPQRQMWDSLQIADHIAICNHSYSHAKQRYAQYYQQPDSVVKDFLRTHDSLGLNNTISRTPGRNIWRVDSLRFTDLKSSTAAADSLAKAGFVLLGWDLEWHYDHTSMTVKQSAEKMVQEIDSAFANGDMKQADHLVLLAHDQVYTTSDDSMQLRQFIKRLKEKDEYELALVTNYPGALRKLKRDSLLTKALRP